LQAPLFTLHDLGWDDGFAAAFESFEDDELVPARVAAQHRGGYDVLTEGGERRVRVTGRLRHEAASAAELPAVGDWVALRDETIHAVLPRRSAFSRKAAWAPTEEQVLAANLDAIFIVSALDGDLNLRRLERYLTLAWESGATPVLVLTKADLCEDVAGALFEVEQVALGAAVHAVSNVTGDGLEELAPYLAPARTIALLGSSGVGKSTLANRLAGEELQRTHEIAEDGRGRHTTVSRQLIRLWAVPCSWTPRACARCSSGTPTRESRRRSPTWTSWRPTVASTTARTPASLTAPSRPRSPTDGSRASGSRATASSSASFSGWR
jgi:ribosome biogenesis GTPase